MWKIIEGSLQRRLPYQAAYSRLVTYKNDSPSSLIDTITIKHYENGTFKIGCQANNNAAFQRLEQVMLSSNMVKPQYSSIPFVNFIDLAQTADQGMIANFLQVISSVQPDLSEISNEIMSGIQSIAALPSSKLSPIANSLTDTTALMPITVHSTKRSIGIIQDKRPIALSPDTPDRLETRLSLLLSSSALDTPQESDYYYHSTGAMNPIKLLGILRAGILSKHEADLRGISIDANGVQCNGAHYVSVGTHFGACVTGGRGAFHFVIERAKIETFVRGNPDQDMPTERQIYSMVPKKAIKAIQLEPEAFQDIEHPSIKLDIGIFPGRASVQVMTYIRFMKNEFQYDIPEEDKLCISQEIHKMKCVDKFVDYFEQCRMREKLEQNIDSILKKHLKICYQKQLMHGMITPYAILRYHDPNISVYDRNGKEINCSNAVSVPRGFFAESHGTEKNSNKTLTQETYCGFKPGFLLNK